MSYHYEESSLDFDKCSDNVSKLIFTITNNTDQLGQYMSQLDTNNTIELKNKIHSIENESNDIVKRALTAFRTLSNNYNKEDFNQKSRYNKLRQDFRKAVEEYNQLQKTIAVNARQNESTGDWKDFADEKSQLLGEPKKQQMSAFIQEDEEEMRRLQNDDIAIRNIENDILNINQVFRDLNEIINDQGDMVDTIEENIDNAHGQVIKADTDLTAGLKHRQKARKNKMCMVIALIIGAIILALILFFAFK